MNEDIWIIQDREIWDLCRDERVKYSIEEVDELKGASTQRLGIVNGWKKRLQFAEIKEINYPKEVKK